MKGNQNLQGIRRPGIDSPIIQILKCELFKLQKMEAFFIKLRCVVKCVQKAKQGSRSNVISTHCGDYVKTT